VEKRRTATVRSPMPLRHRSVSYPTPFLLLPLLRFHDLHCSAKWTVESLFTVLFNVFWAGHHRPRPKWQGWVRFSLKTIVDSPHKFYVILINIGLYFYTIKIRIRFCQNIAKIIKKSLVFMHTAKSLKKSYHISIQRKFQKKKISMHFGFNN